MEALRDAVIKISTQLDELRLDMGEVKETITRQRNDALLERFGKLESSMRDQHIKLDALNALNINPTIEAPRPAVVRVAGKKKDEIKEEINDEDVVVDEPPQFNNIVEYFKHVWVTQRAKLYEKGVYSQKEYDDLYDANKDSFDKKKKNELLLQKGIAFKIWKSLDENRKEIVKAMKNQNANDINKNASKEVEVE